MARETYKEVEMTWQQDKRALRMAGDLAIDEAVYEAVIQGESSIAFREFIKGVYSSIDDLHENGLVAEESLMTMKVEVMSSMIWLGKHVNERLRQ